MRIRGPVSQRSCDGNVQPSQRAAKNWLYVCFPLRYYWPGRSDRHTFAQRTRFLPDKVLKCFQQCVTDPLADEDDESSAASGRVIGRSVRRRTKDLWG